MKMDKCEVWDCLFFFSSRRRHTRYWRDWSSDVCSSDLGLLVEDHRVAPYCPRCGTGLSDHEVAQGYESITDPSVYVRLPVTSGEWAGRADLLIWTTTPWTLPSNTAVAVHPDVAYVVARTPGEGPDAGTFVVAEPLLSAVLGEDAEGQIGSASCRER